MQKRQFSHFANNALVVGFSMAFLVLLTFFLVRYFINQARSQKLKSQARVELLEYAQLLEDDIARQTILTYGLDAFLAADEDDDLNDPELTSEIQSITRALATRSTLVSHVLVATPDPSLNGWRSSYEVHLKESADHPHLEDTAQLLEVARSLGDKSDINSEIMLLGTKRYLVTAKAVYRQGQRWGYVFSDIELEGLVKDALLDSGQQEFTVELDFFNQGVQSNASTAVAVPVKTFGQSWQLLARPTDGWRAPLFPLPLFLGLAGFAASVIGILVYLSTFESRKANWLALFDNLTGAGNRRYLELEFQKLVAHGEFGLILFDVDNFKKINETYGFALGDQVLIEVAERIERQLAPGQFLGRVGNDEFVVLSAETQKNQLDALAGRVQHAMSEPLLFNKNIISLITNIGISRYPLDETSLGGLIEYADHHSLR
jgi:diguanylate cyclase (GGDEF)-like protein